MYRRRLLKRLLAIWVAVVAAHYVGMAFLVSASSGNAAAIIAAVLVVEAPLAVGGLLVSVAVFRDARSADGARLHRRSRRHSIRRRGSLTPVGNDTWIVWRDTTFKDVGM